MAVSSNKKTPVSKGKSTDKLKEKPKEKNPLRAEIISILTISAALLMLIGLFIPSGTGILGWIAKSLLTGLFGLGAYFLPFILIAGCLIVLLGKGKNASTAKIIMSGILFVIFISFVYVISDKYTEYDSVLKYIEGKFNAGGAGNGGLIGSVFGDLFMKILGSAGTYVLFLTAGIILLVLITGKSFFALIARCFAYFDKELKNQRAKAAVRKEYEAQEKQEIFESYEPYEPPSGKRVFDYTVGEGQSVDDERLHLMNDAFINDTEYYKQRLLDQKNPPSEEKIEFKRPAAFRNKFEDDESEEMQQEQDDETQEDGIQEDLRDIAPWETDDGQISVRGTGVEGYTPMAVDAEGEVFDELEKNSAAGNAARNSDEYIYPPIELLKENPYVPSLSSKAHILENSRKLEETLKSFGVEAKVVEVCKGPTVTRYELSPGIGVKVSKISGLADDLALNLAAVGIRIEAPVPGKSVVGIEIPNKEAQSVYLREVIDDEAFWAYPSKISFAMGKDIAGNTVIADIAKMPHLLIAGATGSGKSVCINTLIASIVYKANPEEVKLLMIDPKVVELSVYNGIPHLLIPVVTEPKKAAGALNWAVREMDIRYNMFAETMTRDLKGFNATREGKGEALLPQIVIIIDELADLMMTCGKEVEEAICRLAQKARAAGIHLIIATQRPSVDVITGLIKANVPSRLAFAVSSGTDSRTILDMIGAEKLLGKGDMLFSPVGLTKPQRIQGSFISDKEVENLVNFIKREKEHEYDPEMIEKITTVTMSDNLYPEGSDEFTDDAIGFVVSKEKASVSMLQRRFRIGYNRAARLMEELEDRGIVGPEDGSKPRKVLMSNYQWQDYKERKEHIEY